MVSFMLWILSYSHKVGPWWEMSRGTLLQQNCFGRDWGHGATASVWWGEISLLWDFQQKIVEGSSLHALTSISMLSMSLSFKATRKRWWACRSCIRNLQTGICIIQGKREKSLTVKLPKSHFGNNGWKIMSHSYADFQRKCLYVFHGMVHPLFLHNLII